MLKQYLNSYNSGLPSEFLCLVLTTWHGSNFIHELNHSFILSFNFKSLPWPARSHMVCPFLSSLTSSSPAHKGTCYYSSVPVTLLTYSLCSSSSPFLGFSSLKYLLGSLSHLLQVFAQMSPSQACLSWHLDEYSQLPSLIVLLLIVSPPSSCM